MNTLPKQRFTYEEEILRSAILNFLKAWAGEHEQVPATTEDLGACLVVQEAKLMLCLYMFCCSHIEKLVYIGTSNFIVMLNQHSSNSCEFDRQCGLRKCGDEKAKEIFSKCSPSLLMSRRWQANGIVFLHIEMARS